MGLDLFGLYEEEYTIILSKMSSNEDKVKFLKFQVISLRLVDKDVAYTIYDLFLQRIALPSTR